MKPITKTLMRSEDCYIQFTDQEMEKLDIKVNDKFSCKINKDQSITLEKYVPFDIDFSEWDKEELIFLIEDSCRNHIPIEEVIEKRLRDYLKLYKTKSE